MICIDPYCVALTKAYGPRPHLTIRESTKAEREHLADFWATGKPMQAERYLVPMQAERYLVVEADHPENWLGAFGTPDGGDTREEAVFWAERWASKNGGHFIRPEGWEDVIGDLPEREDD